MTIRAVLFDWDGTIVHSDALVIAAPAAAVARYARQKIGFALPDEVFEAAFQNVLPPYTPGLTTRSPEIRALLNAAFEHCGQVLEPGQLDVCAAIFFAEANPLPAVFDDARAILASLKYRGYRIGVVTNSIFPGTLFAPRISELGLTGYIDTVVSSADIGLGKPEPEPYLAALKALDVQPHEALFVGDRPDTDIAGALAAGIRAALIDRTNTHPQTSRYHVVPHLSHLNHLLGEEILSD
jgi:putative hydrolase of the HAD superfamily